jgi:hypothetical protein
MLSISIMKNMMLEMSPYCQTFSFYLKNKVCVLIVNINMHRYGVEWPCMIHNKQPFATKVYQILNLFILNSS